MPFAEDRNPRSIITQAQREGYGQNSQNRAYGDQFYACLGKRSYFSGFLGTGLVTSKLHLRWLFDADRSAVLPGIGDTKLKKSNRDLTRMSKSYIMF